MRDRAITLLRELTEAPGVSGHEDAVRAIVHRELSADPGHAFETDNNGSLICTRAGDDPEAPRVMLTAHMDEIGFMVQNITPDGFLQFITLGGWWMHTVMAQPVHVINRHGAKIPGVIGSTPPHFLPSATRDKLMPVEQMFIDIGAGSREQVRADFGIRLGDPVVPAADFQPLHLPDFFMSKAFDNRVGVSLLIQTLAKFAGTKLPNQLLGVATVQEEMGLRGARTATRLAKPDVALVLEGPPADDSPGFNPAESQCALGGGVQIRAMDPTAIMSRRLIDLTLDAAREAAIPHQVTVRRGGGTDAGAIHLSETGVPCVVIGVPVRYIHSHHGIMNIGDYLQAFALVTALLRRLDADTIKALTTFL